MTTIIWKPTALSALDAITRDRLISVGAVAARRIRRRITMRVAQLREFPELGRLVPEWAGTNLRELIVPPYRIPLGLTQLSAAVASE
ncbi:MAG: type II toxin-antitoxin system RelE/ParE family toxin [Thermomicrobiales bacterium]